MPQVPAPYTAIPSAVLVHQAQLGLTPQQVCLIAQLQSFQWDARLPFPSVATLARRMGCSRSQVYTYLHQLQARGYLVVQPRRRPDGGTTSNAYDLSPLWRAAQALAATANRSAPAPAGAAASGEGPPARQGDGAAADGPPPPAPAPPVRPAGHETSEQNYDEWNHHSAARPESPARAIPAAPSPSTPVAAAGGELVSLLRRRGVTARTAQLLVHAYPEARIREQLAHLERLPEPPRNPAGWLVCAIRHNYRDAQDTARRQRAEAGAAPVRLPAPAAAVQRHDELRTCPSPPVPPEQRAASEVAALEEIRLRLGLGPYSREERARREQASLAYYASRYARLTAGPAVPAPAGAPAARREGRAGPMHIASVLAGVLGPASPPGPAAPSDGPRPGVPS